MQNRCLEVSISPRKSQRCLLCCSSKSIVLLATIVACCHEPSLSLLLRPSKDIASASHQSPLFFSPQSSPVVMNYHVRCFSVQGKVLPPSIFALMKKLANDLYILEKVRNERVFGKKNTRHIST
ncbi:hypothetical protein DEO72_LG8g1611 [Vigna unguiculata]|uniref:Uncharacterized protein n=1 Tax=Vigna unguiculata TaxID=3917 RepID=A0A4D6MQ35_VIGUN|nr:hypothetical protein DEO72_LG8g1611 [Vigna unguiculata]